MIHFKKKQLDNGLTVFIQPDFSTPMAALNIAYNVGSKDETPDKTGFAHLFEHLMFSGSQNIPDYDTPLQAVGASNNAFTSTDVTNYYVQIPANNLETALWLESDRMNMLAFSEKGLEVQRKVVVEEFSQRYLNAPYGDLYLEMRPMVFADKNAYSWATIGKTPKHIEDSTMEDVQAFFHKFYCPNNAVLCLSGPFTELEGFALIEKWFGDIESGDVPVRNVEQLKGLKTSSEKILERDVPLDSFFTVYPMAGKKDKDYYPIDLISDVLSRGNSSRFSKEILNTSNLFTDLNAYVTGDWEQGMFVVGGKINKGEKLEDAQAKVDESIQKFLDKGFEEGEKPKLINKIKAQHAFGLSTGINRAMSIALDATMGDEHLINTEPSLYENVQEEEVLKQAKELFSNTVKHTLIYKSK